MGEEYIKINNRRVRNNPLAVDLSNLDLYWYHVKLFENIQDHINDKHQIPSHIGVVEAIVLQWVEGKKPRDLVDQLVYGLLDSCALEHKGWKLTISK